MGWCGVCVVVVVVVVVLTCDLTRVFLHNESVHAPNWGGRTPRSQTHGVPATPEPSTNNNCWPSRAEKWALTSSWTECEKCLKMRQNRPSSALEHSIDERV